MPPPYSKDIVAAICSFPRLDKKIAQSNRPCRKKSALLKHRVVPKYFTGDFRECCDAFLAQLKLQKDQYRKLPSFSVANSLSLSEAPDGPPLVCWGYPFEPRRGDALRRWCRGGSLQFARGSLHQLSYACARSYIRNKIPFISYFTC
jgi:hypothetical protein